MLRIKIPNHDKIVRDYSIEMADALSMKISLIKFLADVIVGRRTYAELSKHKYGPNKSKPTVLRPFLNEGIMGDKFEYSQVTRGNLALELDVITHMISFFSPENISKLFSALPDELLQISDSFDSIMQNVNSEVKLRIVDMLIPYEKFVEYKDKDKNNDKGNSEAYKLAMKVAQPTCPYCNRQFTFLIKSKNGKYIARPEFDHFFAKSNYPLLALSFHNLIPSCHICNSTFKHVRPFSLSTHLHPYIEGFDDDVFFAYGFKTTPGLLADPSEFEIKFQFSSAIDQNKRARIEKNDEDFHLLEVYDYHKDIISEIYSKAILYPKGTIEDLIKNFAPMGFDKKSIYQLVFGNYLYDDEHCKRILARFTRDIVKNTGLYDDVFFD